MRRGASGLATRAGGPGSVVVVPRPTQYRQPRFVPPSGATDLLIVRHGESAPAVEGELFTMIDGQGDPPLAPEGRKQAEAVAERLASAGITAIYTSHLTRTIETAQPLVTRLGITPTVDRDLREVFLGAWEGGVFRQKVAERDPVAERMAAEETWEVIPGAEPAGELTARVEAAVTRIATAHPDERVAVGGVFRQKVAERDPVAERMAAEETWEVIPGAEPAGELTARVEAAVTRIATAHPDERVAVFTHGGIIGVVLALATRSRPFAFVGAANASISRVVVTPGRWIVRGFNDTAHLPSG